MSVGEVAAGSGAMVLCVSRSNPVYASPLSPAPSPGPRLGVHEITSPGSGCTLMAPPEEAARCWYHTGVPLPSSTMA